MADVGLDASLELDIAAALRQVDTIERRLNEATDIVLRADASLITSAIDAAIAAAVDQIVIEANAADVTGSIDSAVLAADDEVAITSDTSTITGDIDSAVDAADDQVTITGDASDITGGITSAVDAADTDVVITGEAPGVTGAIDAAIDAADTTVTIDIPDPGPLRDVASAADDVGVGLVAASAAGGGLSSTLAGLGAAGAAAGLYGLVTAASDLEQAVGGTESIFGEAETAVVAFARNSADAVGLTEEATRSLTSQLGGLLKGFGFTKDEAADLSIQLTTLGADLSAAFGGDTQQAVEAIGAALRGETDPIEQYGISLNAAKVEAKALELGLVSTGEELTANAKATAALAIINEQAADVQGQFGREAETTAGQLQRLQAEAGDAAAQVGQSLQPAMNELIETARSDLIPGLQEVGEALGPALADLALSLAPAFGTLTGVLTLLAPVLQTVADAISLIPAPVLSALGTFAAFSKVTKPLRGDLKGAGDEALSFGAKFTQARAGGAGFTQSLGAMVGGLTPLTVGLTVATTAFTLYSQEQQKIAERHAEQVAQQKAFASALGDTSTSVRGISDALRDVIDAGESLQFENLGIANLLLEDIPAADIFRKAGVSVDQFSEAIAGSHGELERLLQVARKNSPLAATALEDLADQMQAAARQSIIAGQAVGDFTDEQVAAAIESNRNVDGTKNYALALDQLESSAKESAEQQDALAAAVGGVDSEGATGQVTALGLRLADLRGPLEGLGGRFTQFAIEADTAGLSGAELDAVAEELGTTAEQLGPVIGTVVGPINDMASAAADAVPDLSELAGPIEDFSAQGFRDELQDTYRSLIGFRDNLTILSDFSPRLAAAAAELGPAYTSTLAEALREGNTDVLDEASLLLAGIDEQQQGLVDVTRNEFGPALVEEMGLVGTGMTDAFGNSLNLVEPTHQSIRAIEGTVEEESGAVVGSTGKLGADATNAFGQAFAPDPRPGLVNADAQVQEAGGSWLTRLSIFADQGDQGFLFGFNPDPRPGLLGAGSAVDGQRGSWLTKLSIFGGSGRIGFQGGISGLSSDASGAVDSAISAIDGKDSAAYTGGYGIGGALGDGVIAGIQSKVAAAQAQTNAFMDAVLNAGLNAAGIASPSKVWRDRIGVELAAGLVAGLEDGVADAENAAIGVVDSMTSAAAGAIGATGPLAVAGSGSLTAGPGGSFTAVSFANGAVQIVVPPGTPPAQAEQIVARGLDQALARRNVRTTARLSGSRG